MDRAHPGLLRQDAGLPGRERARDRAPAQARGRALGGGSARAAHAGAGDHRQGHPGAPQRHQAGASRGRELRERRRGDAERHRRPRRVAGDARPLPPRARLPHRRGQGAERARAAGSPLPGGLPRRDVGGRRREQDPSRRVQERAQVAREGGRQVGGGHAPAGGAPGAGRDARPEVGGRRGRRGDRADAPGGTHLVRQGVAARRPHGRALREPGDRRRDLHAQALAPGG